MNNSNQRNNTFLMRLASSAAAIFASILVVPFIASKHDQQDSRPKVSMWQNENNAQFDAFTDDLKNRLRVHAEKERQQNDLFRQKLPAPKATSSDKVFDEVMDSLFPPKPVKPRSTFQNGVLTTHFENLSAHQKTLLTERLQRHDIAFDSVGSDTIVLRGRSSVQARKQGLIKGDLKADYMQASRQRRYLPSEICNQTWHPVVNSSGEVEVRAAVSTLNDKQALYDLLKNKDIPCYESINSNGVEYLAIKGEYAVEMYQASLTNKRLTEEQKQAVTPTPTGLA